MIKPITLLAGLTPGLAGANTAVAHAMLTHATPAVGSTISAAPTAIELDFTEGVVPAFCSILIQSAAGASVKTGKPTHAGDEATLKAPVAAALPPGTYSVSWHAVSVDTHRTQGRFTFTIAR